MSEDRAIDRPGVLPHDEAHERAYHVARDLLNGRITALGRDILRDALDKAPVERRPFPVLR